MEITKLKIKQMDGTFGKAVDLGATSDHVIMSDGKTLTAAISAMPSEVAAKIINEGNNAITDAIEEAVNNESARAIEVEEDLDARVNTNTADVATLKVKAESIERDYLNLVIGTLDWSQDNVPYKENGYPYKAFIKIANCKETDIPRVVPSLETSLMYILAPIATSAAGGVYVYASSKPTKQLTIDRVSLRGSNV